MRSIHLPVFEFFTSPFEFVVIVAKFFCHFEEDVALGIRRGKQGDFRLHEAKNVVRDIFDRLWVKMFDSMDELGDTMTLVTDKLHNRQNCRC